MRESTVPVTITLVPLTAFTWPQTRRRCRGRAVTGLPVLTLLEGEQEAGRAKGEVRALERGLPCGLVGWQAEQVARDAVVYGRAAL